MQSYIIKAVVKRAKLRLNLNTKISQNPILIGDVCRRGTFFFILIYFYRVLKLPVSVYLRSIIQRKVELRLENMYRKFFVLFSFCVAYQKIRVLCEFDPNHQVTSRYGSIAEMCMRSLIAHRCRAHSIVIIAEKKKNHRRRPSSERRWWIVIHLAACCRLLSAKLSLARYNQLISWPLDNANRARKSRFLSILDLAALCWLFAHW